MYAVNSFLFRINENDPFYNEAFWGVEDFPSLLSATPPIPVEFPSTLRANRESKNQLLTLSRECDKRGVKVIRVSLGQFSCREAVLSQMNEVSIMSESGAFRNLVHLIQFAGSKTTHAQTFRNFSRRFLETTRSSGISMHENDQGFYLSVKTRQSLSPCTTLFVASFLLWLFRYPNVAESAVKNAETSNLTGLYGYLEKAFLDDPDIYKNTDSANPRAVLSLFAFGRRIGDSFGGNSYANGPVSAVFRFTSPNTLVLFIKHVLWQKYPSYSQLESVVSSLGSSLCSVVLEMSSLFYENKELKQQLAKLSETAKAKAARKSTKKEQVKSGNA